MFQKHKAALRKRRRLDKVNRINNLLAAEREKLTIPQLRAKRRVDRRRSLAAANKRRKALADTTDVHAE